jgi:deoxyribodipyrimidine photolyase
MVWTEKLAPWLANGCISAKKIYDETVRWDSVQEDKKPNVMTEYILD